MKVLVTGATGFVGSHLCERLIQEGYEVRALARESSDVSLLKSLGIQIVYGNILDIDSVERAVDGCGVVYHLAARTSRHSSSCSQDDYAINIEGTKRVVNAAVKAGIERFVYGSSVGVYGIIKNPPVDEQTPPNPNTCYRDSKLKGEVVVLSQYKNEGLPVVIARISSVYGPRSLNWLSLFQALARKRFRMLGSGENHRDMVYISDVVEGIKLCGVKKGIEGETYILSGKEPQKLNQLVYMIAEELGVNIPSIRSPEFPFRAWYDFATFIYMHSGLELPRAHTYELFLEDRVLNITKAQKELGYDPKVSIREGIQQAVRWYRENGYI
jgi:nucleoside-diphosphate-sugar epimerase